MDRRSAWDDARLGLTFLFWGWLALTLATALETLYTTWAFQGFRGRGDLEAAFRTYRTVSLFLDACALGGLAVAIAGVVRLLRAPTEARLGGLVAGALACFALFALIDLFQIAVTLQALASKGTGQRWVTPRIWRSIALVHDVGQAGAMILMVLILHGIAKRVQALLPFWFGVIVAVLAGFDVLLSLYRLIAGDAFRVPFESPWLWLFVSIGSMVAQNALFLLLIANTRHTLLVRSGAEQAEKDWEGAAGWFGAKEWQGPTRAVGLYAGAVKALLLIIFGGYGALIMAWLMKLAFVAAITVIAIPIGVLITQVVMIVGLAGYASVPMVSRARGLAVGALAAHALALLIDVFSIVAIAGVVAGGSEYAYEAERALARAQLISGFGQAVGLTGFVLLLVSFTRVARFVGAAELARKTTPILIMVILTAASILLMRVVMNSPRVVASAGAGLLALALGVAFLALTSLLMYLAFVNKLHAVLVEGPPETAPAESWG